MNTEFAETPSPDSEVLPRYQATIRWKHIGGSVNTATVKVGGVEYSLTVAATEVAGKAWRWEVIVEGARSPLASGAFDGSQSYERSITMIRHTLGQTAAAVGVDPIPEVKALKSVVSRFDINVGLLRIALADESVRLNPTYVAPDGTKLGAWVERRRRQRGQRPAFDAALEAIPGWSWQHHREVRYADRIAAAREALAAESWDGHEPVRRWIYDRQIARGINHQLDAALEAIPGWQWAPPRSKGTPHPKSLEMLAELRALVDAGGPALPRKTFKTSTGIPIGRWAHERRQDRGVNIQLDRLLEAIPGWQWDRKIVDPLELHAGRIAALRRYAAEHGTLKIPSGYRDALLASPKSGSNAASRAEASIRRSMPNSSRFPAGAGVPLEAFGASTLCTMRRTSKYTVTLVSLAGP